MINIYQPHIFLFNFHMHRYVFESKAKEFIRNGKSKIIQIWSPLILRAKRISEAISVCLLA